MKFKLVVCYTDLLLMESVNLSKFTTARSLPVDVLTDKPHHQLGRNILSKKVQCLSAGVYGILLSKSYISRHHS